jgi:hypothetical protein
MGTQFSLDVPCFATGACKWSLLTVEEAAGGYMTVGKQLPLPRTVDLRLGGYYSRECLEDHRRVWPWRMDWMVEGEIQIRMHARCCGTSQIGESLEGHGTVLKIVEQIGWGLYETCRARTMMAASILRHLFVTVYIRRRRTKRHFSHFYWALKS